MSWIGTNGKIYWIKNSGIRPVSSGTCLGRSWGSNYMGSSLVVWGWMVISCGGDGGCGGDVCCLMMMVVDVVVSGSRSSWMSMIVWVARVVS